MPDWLTLPAAHRGLHGPGRPENSMAAFAAAVQTGVAIELDVHLGAGVVAVFHDPTLERMCGVPGPIAEQTAGALGRLRLAGTAECVPTLPEALELVAGRVPVLVELKPPTPPASGARLCEAVSQTLAGYGGPVAVMSFDPRLLRWFHQHAPHVPRGQLAGSRRVPEAAAAADALGMPRWQQLALEHLAVSLVSRPTFIGYDVRALPHPAPARTRRRGTVILAGIARSLDEVAVAHTHADGVVFEDLDPAGVVAHMRRPRRE